MKPHHRRAAGALQLYVTLLSKCMPSISHWARLSFTADRNLLFEAYLAMHIRIEGGIVMWEGIEIFIQQKLFLCDPTFLYV
jgi:hypothetical protein